MIAYLSCFWTIRFFFLRAFSAYCFPEAMCLTKNTFPNAPEPRTFIILNEAKFTLFVAIELNSVLKLSISALLFFYLYSRVSGWKWLLLFYFVWESLLVVFYWDTYSLVSESFVFFAVLLGASWLLFDKVLCLLSRLLTNNGLFFFGYFLTELSNSTSSIMISCLLI